MYDDDIVYTTAMVWDEINIFVNMTMFSFTSLLRTSPSAWWVCSVSISTVAFLRQWWIHCEARNITSSAPWFGLGYLLLIIYSPKLVFFRLLATSSALDHTHWLLTVSHHWGPALIAEWSKCGHWLLTVSHHWGPALIAEWSKCGHWLLTVSHHWGPALIAEWSKCGHWLLTVSHHWGPAMIAEWPG